MSWRRFAYDKTGGYVLTLVSPTGDVAVTEILTSVEDCVDKTLAAVGNHIVMAAPLGLGKPVQLINAFYRRVAANPALSLHIITALCLEVPQARQRNRGQPGRSDHAAPVRRLRGTGLPGSLSRRQPARQYPGQRTVFQGRFDEKSPDCPAKLCVQQLHPHRAGYVRCRRQCHGADGSGARSAGRTVSEFVQQYGHYAGNDGEGTR